MIRLAFAASSACAAALLAAAAIPARAQTPAAKLDPLLRPLANAEVAERIALDPTATGMATAVGRPLQSVLSFSRQPGRVDSYVDVFVSLTTRSPEAIERVGGIVAVQAGSLFGARVPVTAIQRLAADPRVARVEAATMVRVRNDLAMSAIRAAEMRERSGLSHLGATGAGVIVGEVDTGVDWSHPDFKHADGTTRILYIWEPSAAGGTPPGVIDGQDFSRGHECTSAMINAGSCSQRDINGHGTHVMGTAAGNGAATGNGQPQYQHAGVALNAQLVVVKGGDHGFSTLNLVEGIQYIFKRATQLGRPAVVNVSIGGQFGAHDGSGALEQTIDSLSGPGRIVVMAAGNEGSNPTATTGNTPYLIHATRTLAATGDTAQITISIPSYLANPGPFNDFALYTMWYDGRDDLTIAVRRPDGTTFSRRTGDPAGGVDASQGTIFIDNAAAGPSAQNGDNVAEIEIFDNDATRRPASGTWRITVTLNARGGTGRFDVWQYASSFAAPFASGGDNAYVLNTLATGARSLAVAAYTTRVSWTSLGGSVQYNTREEIGNLATFSSPGPTRPRREAAPRQKPDLTAPGKGIFSALSSQIGGAVDNRLIAPSGRHVVFSGTSMATPMVTGAVALMLERKPDLTPEEARALLTGNVQRDAFTAISHAGLGAGYPNASWGYGKLDIEAAVDGVMVEPSTLTMAGASPDTVVVLRADAALQLARFRLLVEGYPVRLDSLRFRTEATAAREWLTNIRLVADLDSNGLASDGEPVVAAALTIDGTGVLRVVPSAKRLLLGGRWYVLLADGSQTATWGQNFQLRLDSADVFAQGRSTGLPAGKLGVSAVVGRRFVVGGQAEIAAASVSRSLNARLALGSNAALELRLAVSTLEGAVVHAVTLDAESSAPLASVVSRAALYTASAAGSTTPQGPPLAETTNPFANGSRVSFPTPGLTIPAGGSLTLVAVVETNDRLRQGDTLVLRATAISGTGALSARPAVVSFDGTAVLGSADLLDQEEALLISENPVRDGRVTFSYNEIPRSMVLYNAAGVRVREFASLPESRFEWDVRAETPGLPNGMYLLVVDVGGQRLRRRLMLLSPSR